MSKKCILVITDGIGANPDKNDTSNAFMRAKKPTYDRLFKKANSLCWTELMFMESVFFKTVG